MTRSSGLRRAFMSLRMRWQQALLAGANWSGASLVVPPLELVGLMDEGGLLSRSSRIWSEIVRQWAEADLQWRAGNYRCAIELRRQALSASYQAQGADPLESPPPLMSAGWSSNIGHLGWLGIFSLAQHRMLVPAARRRLILGPRVGNASVVTSLSSEFESTTISGASAMLETPMLWPLVERLQMVATDHGFQDMYEICERVHNYGEGVRRSDSRIALDPEYLEVSRRALHEAGLGRTESFVSLHIRDSGVVDDPREAPSSTFIPAIEELNRRGVKVIRFGHAGSSVLPALDGLIDLTTLRSGDSSLDLFVVAESQFLLTTTSGPAYLASALGVPLAHTNTTSIGRNLASSPRGSRFLPMHWVKRVGLTWRSMTFREVLASPMAYWEPWSKRDFDSDLASLPNTADEIVDLVTEVLERTSSADQDNTFTPSDSLVATAQSEMRAVGRGRLASTFAERHPNYLAD